MPNFGLFDAEEDAAMRERVYGKPKPAPSPAPASTEILSHLPKKDREKAQMTQTVNSMLITHQQAAKQRELLRDQ